MATAANAPMRAKAGSAAENSASGGAGALARTSAQGGAGSAGSAGSSQAAAAGVPATGSNPAAEPNDSDAGPPPESSEDVTIVAEASFARTSLTVAGATCVAGRCTLAPPSDGKLKVQLTLEHSAGEPMPVLARWQGCGTPTTEFFPVTPSSSDYILNYESDFSDLRAGSRCTAEIVEGGWLVFAGNMSTQILEGESYCTLLQVSQMGINASCFPPPGTRVVIGSDLPRWDCVSIAPDGTLQDSSFTQAQLSLLSVANQLVSCTGAAQ